MVARNTWYSIEFIYLSTEANPTLNTVGRKRWGKKYIMFKSLSVEENDYKRQTKHWAHNKSNMKGKTIRME